VILYTANSVLLIQKTASQRAALKHVGNSKISSASSNRTLKQLNAPVVSILNNTPLIWQNPVQHAAVDAKDDSSPSNTMFLIVDIQRQKCKDDAYCHKFVTLINDTGLKDRVNIVRKTKGLQCHASVLSEQALPLFSQYRLWRRRRPVSLAYDIRLQCNVLASGNRSSDQEHFWRP